MVEPPELDNHIDAGMTIENESVTYGIHGRVKGNMKLGNMLVIYICN